ncbi:MAG TPA: hypothetical protein VLJ14_18435 [Ktedonobacterales bacterium]|nr:hypothetical protein [Ktedonobacterales bacterium]
MSVTLHNKPLTAKQRNNLALQRLCAKLGIEDSSLLATAVLEVVADEVGWNGDVGRRIRDVYRDLIQLSSLARAKPRPSKPEPVKLVPVGKVDESRINPYGPLDPYLLFDMYGAHQLRLALDGYSLAKLKEGMAAVEARNPGTKPKSKASKAPLIDYIVEHIAGPGY